MLRLIGLTLALMLAPPVSGEPWKRHTIDDSSRGADGVRLMDVNGDGLLDIATGWEEGGSIRVYANPGSAASKRRWPSVEVGRVASPEDAVFADLDGDGAIDVVSACEARTRSLFVHWAPRSRQQYLRAEAWVTEALPASRDAQMWMHTLPAQVDGVRGIDLFAGGKGKDASVGFFLSPGDPRRLPGWKFHKLRDAGWIMSLVWHDMNGDRRKDLLISDRKRSATSRSGVYWLENPGDAEATQQTWRQHAVGAVDEEVMFLTQSDVDRDGLLDVIVSTKPNRIILFRRSSADGRDWLPIGIQTPADSGSAKAVSAADIDLNGKIDLVFSTEGADSGKQGLMWLSWDQSPLEAENWRFHVLGGSDGVKHDQIELIDMDGDGDLDVLTCEETKNLGVIWYENPSK